MKLHIQHRLAEACISWGDYLRLGAVSFLQLQQESYACTLEAQPEYLLLYVKEGTSQLTIAVGCTGGKHRSITFARKIGEYCQQLGYQAGVQHRDAAR